MPKIKNLLAEINKINRHCLKQAITGAKHRTPAHQSELIYGQWCHEGKIRKRNGSFYW